MDLEHLKKKLLEAKREYKDINSNSEKLRNNYKKNFPRKSCPVFLYRNPQSGIQLHWRYASSIVGKVGDKIKTHIGKEKQSDFWKEIEGVKEEDKLKLFEFELERIKINYRLSLTTHKIKRLKSTIESLEEWGKCTRKI